MPVLAAPDNILASGARLAIVSGSDEGAGRTAAQLVEAVGDAAFTGYCMRRVPSAVAEAASRAIPAAADMLGTVFVSMPPPAALTPAVAATMRAALGGDAATGTVLGPVTAWGDEPVVEAAGGGDEPVTGKGVPPSSAGDAAAEGAAAEGAAAEGGDRDDDGDVDMGDDDTAAAAGGAGGAGGEGGAAADAAIRTAAAKERTIVEVDGFLFRSQVDAVTPMDFMWKSIRYADAMNAAKSSGGDSGGGGGGGGGDGAECEFGESVPVPADVAIASVRAAMATATTEWESVPTEFTSLRGADTIEIAMRTAASFAGTTDYRAFVARPADDAEGARRAALLPAPRPAPRPAPHGPYHAPPRPYPALLRPALRPGAPRQVEPRHNHLPPPALERPLFR